MNRWRWLVCWWTVAVFAAAAAAGEPSRPTPGPKASVPAAPRTAIPTVDAVLQRWIAARGGQEAIQATTNYVAVGQAEAAHLGAAVRCELYARAPRQRVAVFQLPGQGAVVEGCDGGTAWLDDPAFGRTEWTGEELAKRRRDATFHRELQFPALYPDLNVRGMETAAGEPAWLLEAHVSPAADERFWFSERTGLLVRQESTLHLALGLVERSVEYSDYRLAGGVRFPYRWQLRQRGASQAEPEVSIVIHFADVKFNVPMGDARFRRHQAE